MQVEGPLIPPDIGRVNMDKHEEREERVASALEAIAKSLCILAEVADFFRSTTSHPNVGGDIHEAGRGRDSETKGDRAPGTDDRTKPKHESDRPQLEQCQYPIHRYGYDISKSCAVCSYNCPLIRQCKIPHNQIGEYPPGSKIESGPADSESQES